LHLVGYIKYTTYISYVNIQFLSQENKLSAPQR
jgi:hypothetical protein